MSAHQFPLNREERALLFPPGESSPLQDHSISVDKARSTTAQTTRNLGVTIETQLSYMTHIAAIPRSFWFALYTICRIRRFLIWDDVQLLVEALVISRLDYCSSLPARIQQHSLKPLQFIQNTAACLDFNFPKCSQVPSSCILSTGTQWLTASN